MRAFVLVDSAQGPELAILDEDRVRLLGIAGDRLPELLGEPSALAGMAADSGRPRSIADAVLLPPLDRGSRVFCVAQNYPAHAAEAGGPSTSRPIIFLKPVTSFVGHRQDAVIASVTTQFDYEGEIGAVIGRRASRETRESAMSAVAGYTIGNDGSARDLQPSQLAGRVQIDWFAAKSIDRSSALGPGIVAASDVGAIADMRIQTFHNGELVQDDVGASMTHDLPSLIVFISRLVTLLPGDVILTGTPAGVGKARGVFLAPGDEVRVAVSGLGELTTRYAAEEPTRSSAT